MEFLTIVPASLVAALGLPPVVAVTKENLMGYLDEALARLSKLLKGNAAQQFQSLERFTDRISREELDGN